MEKSPRTHKRSFFSRIVPLVALAMPLAYFESRAQEVDLPAETMPIEEQAGRNGSLYGGVGYAGALYGEAGYKNSSRGAAAFAESGIGGIKAGVFDRTKADLDLTGALYFGKVNGASACLGKDYPIKEKWNLRPEVGAGYFSADEDSRFIAKGSLLAQRQMGRWTASAGVTVYSDSDLGVTPTVSLSYGADSRNHLSHFSGLNNLEGKVEEEMQGEEVTSKPDRSNPKPNPKPEPKPEPEPEPEEPNIDFGDGNPVGNDGVSVDFGDGNPVGNDGN